MTTHAKFRSAFLVAALGAGQLLGCAGSGDGLESTCEGAKCDDLGQSSELGLCVGIRGNGQLIPAHFASLARIVEHYGPIDGSAGGSSASITQFVLSAMQQNPDVWQCGEIACSDDQVKARLSLLLKTFPAYIAYVATETPEAKVLADMKAAFENVQTGQAEALLETDVDAAAEALSHALASDTIVGLINPELIHLLQTVENPEPLVRDIIAAIKSFGNFSTDDKNIFFRPGLISFEAFAGIVDHMATFYSSIAGFTDSSWAPLFDQCAEKSRGLTWHELAAGDASCGAMLHGMLDEYFAVIRDTGIPPQHLDEEVGTGLAAVVSTSVLTGDAVTAWRRSFDRYLAGQDLDFEVNFDDVKFGYWGRSDLMQKIAANTRGYDDPKTRKFLDLGTTTWRQALSLSPAEPGLARALDIDSDRMSAGGWSDLHPTLILKNMGCEKVVYVTRAGGSASFARGVAAHFGMSEAEDDALYNIDNPESSFSQSVAESDGVWCTNWNDIPATELFRLVDDAYSADFETRDASFTEVSDPYENTSPSLARPGCSPSH